MSLSPKCGIHFNTATRSIPQNKSYWLLCVTPMAEAAGTTPEEMHECLKVELLSKQITVNTKDGVEFKKIVESTTKLTTKEFSEYMERVKEIAARVYGIVCRDPNEQLQGAA